MYSILSLPSLYSVSLFFRLISADCQSTGTDYVDGGGPYCVNTTSTDYFSFGTIWEGCVASDTQGDVTPILIDPNTNEYYCSDISTLPSDVEMTSTCDVPGNVVTKNQMISGTWIVVLEGLTFAWMRSFSIIAAPPVTVTSTPTFIYSYTSTPKATSTSTSTVTYISTLPAVTVTVPSTTLTKTNTITPAPVTSTVNSVLTLSNVLFAFSQTTKTITVTTSCITKLGPWDRLATIHPTKASQAAKTGSKLARSDMSPAQPRRRFHKDRAWAQGIRREVEARGLLEARTLDVCTTTVLATRGPSTTITITAPTSTIIIPTAITTTTTSTPSPVTTMNGKASITITITKPTPTVTKTQFGITNTIIWSTIWATLTSTIKVKPTGVTCIGL